MPAVVRSVPQFTATRDQAWHLSGWASHRVVAGGTSRHLDLAQFLETLDPSTIPVEAEQVHGSSVAIIGAIRPVVHRARHSAPHALFRFAKQSETCGAPQAEAPPQIIPGCDALLTQVPGIALLVRTADCLPILFADRARGVVGIAHVGWRGLAASLPARVVAAFRHMYQSRPAELSVAIGPAIRACCYEVGPEFSERFGPFVQERSGRRTCDLVGIARDQLARCGIRPAQVLDTRTCTACDAQRWFSRRQDGPGTGRLTSMIMVKP